MRKRNGLLLVGFYSLVFSCPTCAQETTVRDRAQLDPNPVTPAMINTELTAIDRYIAAPDASYRWELVSTQNTSTGTLFVIDLKSQTWLKPDEVNRPVWQHWLTVFKPTGVTSNKALMFIGGGGNGSQAPKGLDPMLSAVAAATKSVVAELKQVPNQPLIFHGDGKPRVEDDLIGYTWDQYIKTGDDRWYVVNIPIADRRYDEHLDELRKEGLLDG